LYFYTKAGVIDHNINLCCFTLLLSQPFIFTGITGFRPQMTYVCRSNLY